MIPYQIGTTANNLVSLESLGVTEAAPKATVPEYERYDTLGNGTQRGRGWLVCEWRFPYISLTAIAALRATYCTGKSADVYIRTLGEAGTYSVYSATMHWPQKLPPKVDFIADFVIRFTNMAAV